MTAENGIEFAIRRVKDGFFLYDDNLDGARPEWVSLADNAAWFGTAEEAVAFAELAGFADDGELDAGLEVADRPWVWEEDIEPDEVDLELDREEAKAAKRITHAETVAETPSDSAPAVADSDALRKEFLGWALQTPALHTGKPLSEITVVTQVSHLRHMSKVLAKTGSTLADKVQPTAFDYGSYERFKPVYDAIMADPECIKNSRRVNRTYLRTAIQYYLRFLAQRDGVNQE